MPCASAPVAQQALQINAKTAPALPIFFPTLVRRIFLRNKKAPREPMGHFAALFLAKSAAVRGSRKFPDFRPSGRLPRRRIARHGEFLSCVTLLRSLLRPFPAHGSSQ
jgi:hypothetical protein